MILASARWIGTARIEGRAAACDSSRAMTASSSEAVLGFAFEKWSGRADPDQGGVGLVVEAGGPLGSSRRGFARGGVGQGGSRRIEPVEAAKRRCARLVWAIVAQDRVERPDVGVGRGGHRTSRAHHAGEAPHRPPSLASSRPRPGGASHAPRSACSTDFPAAPCERPRRFAAPPRRPFRRRGRRPARAPSWRGRSRSRSRDRGGARRVSPRRPRGRGRRWRGDRGLRPRRIGRSSRGSWPPRGGSPRGASTCRCRRGSGRRDLRRMRRWS